MPPGNADVVAIDAALVRRLVAAQFPDWADLAIRAVEPGGWDNRTFRLGEHMSVRLPSAAAYAAQVDKEQRWLPYLAPKLPLAIPVPLARGAPGGGYPWPWSVYRRLDGEPAAPGFIADPVAFARALAGFVVALARIDASDGPAAARHSFHRGGRLSIYDAETRTAISRLGGRIDAVAAGDVWTAAIGSRWQGPPVWVHGDIAPGNLLIASGRLSAVIDFGCLAVGDPACDLAIAWTLFRGDSRADFRAAVEPDDDTWDRARGWALWKALVSLAGDDVNPRDGGEWWRVVGEVLADRKRLGPGSSPG